MLETLQIAGIPYLNIMSLFIPSSEMLCGLLLACGLVTRLSAAVLIIITFVELFTVSLGAFHRVITC